MRAGCGPIGSVLGSFWRGLTSMTWASQTPVMAHTYMVFDFGADEEKAQQARHKLEGWKQAYRLDKKLQIKFDRSGAADGDANAADDAAEESDEAEKPAKAGKSGKTKSKSGAKSAKKGAESDAATGGDVKLLVRLYFSGHEKLSEQQWMERIPTDDLLKSASPRIVREGDADFDETVKQFDALE
jgi:hypothetical protein